MASELDGSNSRQDFFGLALDESALNVEDWLAVQPSLVVERQIYRTSEDPGPLKVCRVIVRMRDDNRFQSAQSIDLAKSVSEQEGIASGRAPKR